MQKLLKPNTNLGILFILWWLALAATCQEKQGSENTTSEGINSEVNTQNSMDFANLSVNYRSAFHTINISKQELTYYKKEHHHAPLSVSAMPDSITTSVYAKAEWMEEEQMQTLVDLILESGFLALDAAYGAPKDQRFYSYEIKLDWKGRKKEVLFRSNPSYPPVPDAFKAVETFLLKLHEEL
ncbi:MAG: hypothetical protein ACPGXL_07995 [Chitinophagales bacterium]